MSTVVEPTTEPIEVQEERAMTELERRHYEEIKRLEERCYVAQTEWESAAAESKSRKARLAELETELRSTIRRGPNPQNELPFDDWRNVPITEALSCTEKQFEKFAECGVTTVGQFEDLRAGKLSQLSKWPVEREGLWPGIRGRRRRRHHRMACGSAF